MTEILSYTEPSDLVVREAVFDHRGGRYIGKGWLRWNPEDGAKIDLVVERTGPPLPRRLGFGYVGWLRPEHYTTIRMQVDGFDWVIAPHVGLVDRMDVTVGSYLSETVRRVIWRREQSSSKRGCSGHVTLAFHERSELFAPVTRMTHVDDRQVQRQWRPKDGLLATAEDLEVCGRLDDKHRATLTWTAPGTAIPRKRTWAFGYALRAALSLCTGCTARVLERHMARDGREYCELQPRYEPGWLSGLEWFSSDGRPTAEECLRFALALSEDETLLTMAWGVLVQLADSNEQRAWGTSELLVAVVLEGILRTLDGVPFRPREAYPIDQALLRLRVSHFTMVSEEQCSDALAAHRRLRHRNAHPEWLSLERRLSREQLTQATDDMAFLSKLYGRIIFCVAGFADVAARIKLP